MLELRRVVAADKDRILEISAKIWEGDDYLPQVFSEWLGDKEGDFWAVTSNGLLIAFQKVSYFTPTDVWLMGLRKDADTRERGVGRFINKEILARLAQNKNITSVRFATYNENYQSINLFSKLGFELVAKRSHKFIAVNEAVAPVTGGDYAIAIMRDLEKVSAYLSATPFLKSIKNLVNIGWEVYPFSTQLLHERFVDAGHCHALVQGGQIKAIALMSYLDCGYISLFEADNQETARALIAHLKAEVGKRGLKELCIFLTEENRISKMLTLCGFKSWEEEDDFLVYELPLATLYSNNLK